MATNEQALLAEMQTMGYTNGLCITALHEEEYGNDSVSDTIVSAQTDTVMPIKNLPAEEWAD